MINLTELKKYFSDEAIQELFQIYLDSYGDIGKDFIYLYDEGDVIKLSQLSHKLYGALVQLEEVDIIDTLKALSTFDVDLETKSLSYMEGIDKHLTSINGQMSSFINKK
ncbi:hypothetical protein L0B53_18545 (plasmid) [Vibrio sp. SS-MA-C1-2]|uniref:hypothetical protein n=1 Tax=Vibrio sp. SS-MA-C1-2 TaxID=2908646 RepID=UPI001F2F5346|nr:hypothetical protein [Vibrio sp. SS-MA-C1-2]UJF20323.1 hypothetical protein L0B53_18545 [Vibrio sp. SS-MA-C1-2]